MATLKPVPGQIILTDREFEDMCRVIALRHRFSPVPTDNIMTIKHLLRESMAELNSLRCGEPAGVLRRSPAGSLAVREQNADGALAWTIPRLEDEDETAKGTTAAEIQTWPVIHNESWLNRLTVGDYEPAKDTK